MNVDSSNFNDALALLESAVAEADFVAIDCELTGLQPPGYALSVNDTETIRYEKIRQASNAYRVIQLGVCVFSTKYTDSNSNNDSSNSNNNASSKTTPTSTGKRQKVMAQPFNFCVFPKESSEFGREECNFMADASSLRFLASHGFDFNQLVEKGIPYWNHRQESDAMEKFSSNMQKSDIKEDSENAEFIRQTTETIDNWLQSSTDRTLELDASNSYLRRLVYQIVRNKYNGFLVAKGNGRQVQVKRLTEKEKETLSKNASKAVLIDIMNASQIVRILAKYRKPMVGHNCLLDLGHVMQHFWDDLPKSMERWKYMAYELTTHVIDTKYMVHNHPALNMITNSSLEQLTQITSETPFIDDTMDVEFQDEFTRYTNGNEHYHEAGYDAYCTGLNLIRMLLYIGKSKDISIFNEECIFDTLLNEESITGVCNKLYLMRSELNCIDLTGYDTPPESVAPQATPAAFLLTGVPRGTTGQVLSSLGATNAEWLENNQCRVMFKDAHVVSESYIQLLIDSSQEMDTGSTIIFMEKEDTETDTAQLDDTTTTTTNGVTTEIDTIGTYNPLKRPLLLPENPDKNDCTMMEVTNEPEEGELADCNESTTINDSHVASEMQDIGLPSKKRRTEQSETST
ncbi:CAF1 family ribonuclease-domain-containing protein [Syncephalis plumigaleata]|nr:CAF1 family ribonuclease-domain-containing protein [Syncephalis plumigaleata]